MDPMRDNVTPKKIGEFNIPKTVIENKVDSLAILEIFLRKNIATWEEVDEVREAVVLHLNAKFPELQLTYSTPTPLKEEAPFEGQEEEKPKHPLYYTPTPAELQANQDAADAMGAVVPKAPEKKQEARSAAVPKPGSSSTSISTPSGSGSSSGPAPGSSSNPLLGAAARPNIASSIKPGSGIKPINQAAKPADAPEGAKPKIQTGPRPLAGPPRIMNKPPGGKKP